MSHIIYWEYKKFRVEYIKDIKSDNQYIKDITFDNENLKDITFDNENLKDITFDDVSRISRILFRSVL